MERGLVLLMILSGCGAASEKGAAPRAYDCPSNASTITLVVTPDPLARGDAVDIEVTWTVVDELTPPVLATLSTGDGPVVEVEVPLALEDQGYPYAWAGSLLNPFGTGAPVGDVGVIASAAVASDCDLTPTAATGFTLE